MVPDVEETISYAMPTFVLDGRRLVHVAAWEHHIGLYPLPAVDGTLEREVAPWRGTEDTMESWTSSRPVGGGGWEPTSTHVGR